MPKPQQNTKRTLLADSANIFLIRFFPALATLLAMVLLSRHTAPDFYGQYQRFWVQWQVMNAVICLGLPALLLTIPIPRIRSLIAGIKTGHCVWAGVWLLAGAAVFAWLQGQAGTLFLPWVAALFLLLNVPVTILEAYLMTSGRYGLIALGSAVYSVCFGILHVLFIRSAVSFTVLLEGLLIASAVRLLLLLVQTASLMKQRSTAGDEGGSVRSLWLHLGLYDIIQVLFRWADKFILLLFLTPGLFAIYFNGTVDVPFLALLLGAVGSALLLHLNKEGHTDADRIRMLRQSSARLAWIVFPLFFFLILFRQELFAVVFKNRYQAAVPLFFISSLVIPLRAYNFTSVLQHKGKGRIINAGALLDLAIALVLMYPLYLLWSLNGVALAFVISTYVQAGFYLRHTARLLHCTVADLLPLASWSKTGVLFLLVFFAGHSLLVRFFNPLNVLILGSSLMVVIVLLLLLPRILQRKR